MDGFICESGGGRCGALSKARRPIEESVRYSGERFGAGELWGDEGQGATSGHIGHFEAGRALLR